MSSTRRRTTAYSIVASLCIGLVLLALLLATQSCEWTLSVYVICGAIVIGSLAAMPYFMRRGFARGSRTPTALGFVMVGLFFWLFGWLVAFAGRSCGGLY